MSQCEHGYTDNWDCPYCPCPVCGLPQEECPPWGHEDEEDGPHEEEEDWT